MDENSVTGIIVENKSGRYAYGCKMVVDASGDADVMYRAFPDWLMVGFFPRINEGVSEKYYGTDGESVTRFIKNSRKLAFEQLKKNLRLFLPL